MNTSQYRLIQKNTSHCKYDQDRQHGSQNLCGGREREEQKEGEQQMKCVVPCCEKKVYWFLIFNKNFKVTFLTLCPSDSVVLVLFWVMVSVMAFLKCVSFLLVWREYWRFSLGTSANKLDDHIGINGYMQLWHYKRSVNSLMVWLRGFSVRKLPSSLQMAL